MNLSFIITVGLAIIILAIAAGVMARNRSARALIMGIGLAAIPVGAYLTGITELTINGVLSLIDWVQRTVFTNVTAWGIGLLVGGIIVFVIGTFLPKGKGPAKPDAIAPGTTTQPTKPRPQVRASNDGAKQPPVVAPQAPGATPKQPQQKGLDAEDAEIEALLRKRGIM